MPQLAGSESEEESKSNYPKNIFILPAVMPGKFCLNIHFLISELV